MRRYNVDCSGYPGCCAVEVLNHFPDFDGDHDVPLNKKLTDDEWFYAIRGDNYGNFPAVAYVLQPIYTFAHSSGENKQGKCTPALLAHWLRKKGEKVVVGAKTKNPNSGNMITVYVWAPSKKFRSMFDKNKEKNAANNGDAN